MRYYSNIATATTLTAGVTSSATVLSLAGVSGLPTTYPFTLSVDVSTDSEEIVTCTSLTGLSATVVRGEDGTAATAHSAGAVVRHMMSARDLREPQDHIAATSGVHGLGTSAFVGTDLAQTLTNKTVSGLSNTLSDIPKGAIPSDVVYLNTAQTLTGKTLSGLSNTFTNIPKTALPSDVLYTGASIGLVSVALDRAASGTQATVGNGLSWTSADVLTDAFGMWSSANPSRLTVQQSGVYLVHVELHPTGVALSSPGTRSVTVFKNGVQYRTINSANSDAQFHKSPAVGSLPMSLVVGDYLEYSPGAVESDTNYYTFTMIKLN